MSDKITRGSCLCGNVKYEAKGELRPIALCHCTQCRKASGHYTAATAAPNDRLTITGNSLQWYHSSDYAERGFCSICGSSLFFRPFEKNRTAIFAGSIDGPTGLKLEAQIWTDSKGDYYELPDLPIVEQSELK